MWDTRSRHGTGRWLGERAPFLKELIGEFFGKMPHEVHLEHVYDENELIVTATYATRVPLPYEDEDIINMAKQLCGYTEPQTETPVWPVDPNLVEI